MTKTAYLAGLAALLAVVISGCSMGGLRPQAKATAPVASAETPADDSDPMAMVSAYADPGTTNLPRPALDPLIAQYSSSYNIPEGLVRRVIVRESRYNPAARNGPYYGLMQISHATARGMGYRGEAGGLLDAETNLRYAVKYLAGAYMVAGGNEDQAVRFYSRGYYYDAKRAGLLEETGLR